MQAFIFDFAGSRVHYDPKQPEILARLKPVTPIGLTSKIEVEGINLLEGKVKINFIVELNVIFILTNNKGLYLHNKAKERFDLRPNKLTQIPSNIGFEGRDGYYLMMKNHSITL